MVRGFVVLLFEFPFLCLFIFDIVLLSSGLGSQRLVVVLLLNFQSRFRTVAITWF